MHRVFNVLKNRKAIALIVIFIVLASFAAIFYMNEQAKPKIRTQCPDVCNDGNMCTFDYCGPHTNYTCISKMTTPCCGNGVCEANENCNLDCG